MLEAVVKLKWSLSFRFFAAIIGITVASFSCSKTLRISCAHPVVCSLIDQFTEAVKLWAIKPIGFTGSFRLSIGGADLGLLGRPWQELHSQRMIEDVLTDTKFWMLA